jgi:hypothetical protein
MEREVKYNIESKTLVLFGALAALPIIVGGYLIIGSARVQMSQSVGKSLSQLAEHAASSVDQTVSLKILHLVELSTSPDLVRAAEVAARTSEGDPQREPKALELDQVWGDVTETHPVLQGILNNEAALHLAQIVANSPLYHELDLIDRAGVVIAASRKPARYYFGKRPWFIKSMGGSESGWLGLSVQRDPASQEGVLTLSWPIRRTDEPIGVVRAVLDARTLFAGITGLRFGDSGHAVLFDARDGHIVSGDVPEFLAGDAFYVPLPDYRRAVAEERAYFVTGAHRPHAELVGYARAQVPAGSQGLDWVVAVEISLDEANAPLAALMRNLLIFFLIMGFAVVLLAFYLSFKLEKPVTDVGVDLHEGAPLRG